MSHSDSAVRKKKQEMEEDIFIGGSRIAFSDKRIIMPRGLESELFGCPEKSIPGSVNIKCKDSESGTRLTFQRKTKASVARSE